MPACVFPPLAGLCQSPLEQVCAASLGIKVWINQQCQPSSTDRPQPDGIGIGIRSYGPTSAHFSALCTLRAAQIISLHGAVSKYFAVENISALHLASACSRVEKGSPHIRSGLLASISHDALQLSFIFSRFSCFVCPTRTW